MDVAITLIALGGIVLLGFVTDVVGQVTPLPRVSLLLLLGFALGPAGVAWLPELGPDLYALVAHMALVMVGFLVGGSVKLSDLKERGATVMWYSWAIVLATIFVLGGAMLEVEGLWRVAPILAAYIVLRVLGRMLGSLIAHRLARTSVPHGQWLGLGLLPQAGVALGIAIAAAEKLPGVADVILPVTLAATVCFEVLGPVITRLLLGRCGQTGTAH